MYYPISIFAGSLRLASVSQTGYMNISIFVRGRVDSARWIVCACEAA